MSLTPSILVTVQTLVVGCGLLLVTRKCFEKSGKRVAIPAFIQEKGEEGEKKDEYHGVDEECDFGDRPPSTTFSERRSLSTTF